MARCPLFAVQAMARARPGVRSWTGNLSRAVIAIAIGAAMSFIQAPTNWFWLAPIGLAASFLLFHRSARPLHAGLMGWLIGFGYFLPGLLWIGQAFLVDADKFAWMRPFAVTLLPLGVGLFWAAAFALAKWIHHRRKSEDTLAAALWLTLCWTAFELLRGHVFTGFPWGLFAFSLIDTPAAQGAAWIGVYALNGALILCGALLGAGILQRGVMRVAAIATGAGPILLLGLIGWARLSTVINIREDAPLIRLVQPNIPQREKWAIEHLPRNLDRLALLSRAPNPDDVAPRLIVWPESAVPHRVDQDRDFREDLASLTPPGADLVLGAFRDGDGTGYRWYNSLFVIDAQADIRSVYDKRHLVPFGEYVPLRGMLERLGLEALAWNSGFTAGSGPQKLVLGDGLSFSPLICYEAIFPQDMPSVANRPDFLLQITNDAWFGDSAGPHQHLAQARWRAIEQGLPLLRAANTGISASIDAYGRIIAHARLGVMARVDARLPDPLPATPYARYGESGLMVLLLLIGAAAIAIPRRKSRLNP